MLCWHMAGLPVCPGTFRITTGNLNRIFWHLFLPCAYWMVQIIHKSCNPFEAQPCLGLWPGMPSVAVLRKVQVGVYWTTGFLLGCILAQFWDSEFTVGELAACPAPGLRKPDDLQRGSHRWKGMSAASWYILVVLEDLPSASLWFAKIFRVAICCLLMPLFDTLVPSSVHRLQLSCAANIAVKGFPVRPQLK